MEGGISPIGGPVPLPGAGAEPPQSVMQAANKVDRLNPVPPLGVPLGHPRSYPVQRAHQVSLLPPTREEDLALPIIRSLGRALAA